MNRLDLVRSPLGSVRAATTAVRPDLRVEATGAAACATGTGSSFDSAWTGRAFAFGGWGAAPNPALQQARAAASYLAEASSPSRTWRRTGLILREEG